MVLTAGKTFFQKTFLTWTKKNKNKNTVKFVNNKSQV